MATQNGISKAALLLAVAALSASCGKDRNREDYNNEQADRQAARVNVIVGTYRGMLYDNSNGALSPIEIQLDTARQMQGRGSDSLPDVRVVFPGRVTLPNMVTIPFRDSYYNDQTGYFTVTISLNLSNLQGNSPISVPSSGSSSNNTTGTTTAGLSSLVDVDIEGTISGDQFQGTMLVKGYESHGTRFTVSRNSVLPTGGRLTSTRNGGGRTSIDPISGAVSECLEAPTRYSNEKGTKPTRLRVDLPDTQAARFARVILPFDTAEMTIRLGEGANYTFHQVQWDHDTGVVSGTSNINGNGGVSLELQIQCREEGTGLACNWYAPYGGTIINPLHFQPVDVPPSQCVQSISVPAEHDDPSDDAPAPAPSPSPRRGSRRGHGGARS